jgi:hypothetical protein
MQIPQQNAADFAGKASNTRDFVGKAQAMSGVILCPAKDPA